MCGDAVRGGAVNPPACVFCEIVARREPANVRYEDDRVIAFDNLLDWAPVMMLLIPKAHMSQSEIWRSGDLLAHMGGVAAELGAAHCPGGYRILSNFGQDGMQSQPHGHLHIIGGAALGPYMMWRRQ